MGHLLLSFPGLNGVCVQLREHSGLPTPAAGPTAVTRTRYECTELTPTAQVLDDGIGFAVPPGWGRFALAGADLRRSALFVAPDLSGTLSVTTIVLPVPLQVKAVAANHHGIAGMYPGSRFIDETETTLAGQPAVVTRMELALGPEPAWVETGVRSPACPRAPGPTP